MRKKATNDDNTPLAALKRAVKRAEERDYLEEDSEEVNTVSNKRESNPARYRNIEQYLTIAGVVQFLLCGLASATILILEVFRIESTAPIYVLFILGPLTAITFWLAKFFDEVSIEQSSDKIVRTSIFKLFIEYVGVTVAIIIFAAIVIIVAGLLIRSLSFY